MFLYSKCGIGANVFGIAFKSMLAVSLSIDLYLWFYKALILKTVNHQQAACSSEYWASARQVDPYEISTQCTHSNEKCFRREKKHQEQIVIKLMDMESALKISLCSRGQLYLMDT